MKRILIIFFLVVGLQGFSQKEQGNVFPVLGMPCLVDLSNRSVNANKLPLNQLVKLKLPIINMNLVHAFSKNMGRILIQLGSKIVLATAFDLASEQLSEYFTWTSNMDTHGQLILTGNLIKELPVGFSGNAQFVFKCIETGNSTVTVQWANQGDQANHNQADRPAISTFYITSTMKDADK